MITARKYIITSLIVGSNNSKLSNNKRIRVLTRYLAALRNRCLSIGISIYGAASAAAEGSQETSYQVGGVYAAKRDDPANHGADDRGALRSVPRQGDVGAGAAAGSQQAGRR